MTNKEIENKRNKLIQIVNMPNTGKLIDIPNSDKKYDSGQVKRFNELYKLALEVGASHISTKPQKTANEGELVFGIQDALQTASMINMCKTASRNFWIALIATLVAAISAIAAWAAVAISAIAAWVAVVRN